MSNQVGLIHLVESAEESNVIGYSVTKAEQRTKTEVTYQSKRSQEKTQKAGCNFATFLKQLQTIWIILYT